MKFKPYTKYKASGVDWFGEIPTEWSAKALKHSVEIRITDGPHETPVFVDEGVQFISAEAIKNSKIDFERRRGFITEETFNEYSKKCVPRRNDIFMVKSGNTTGNFAMVESDETFTIWSPLALIRPDINRLSARFVFYNMAADFFQENVRISCSYGTQPNIGMGVIENLFISVPPLSDQIAIATFLDRETAKIDTLIAKQEKLIVLLKEKRQAVISHAVTKGLDPTVPMKPSGVEWLGDVPEHWEVRAINTISIKITNGFVGPTRDILVSEGVPYIQATHIKRGGVQFDAGYFVTKEWSEEHEKSMLIDGDVLIVQTGAGTGDVALCTSAEADYNCHALIIVSPDKYCLTGAFLATALQSTYGRSILEAIRTGAMHPHLNCGEVKFVKIPLPPLEEQEQITASLSQQYQRIDTLIAKAQQAIALQKEHRTALISAAVTGKIDVREAVQELQQAA